MFFSCLFILHVMVASVFGGHLRTLTLSKIYILSGYVCQSIFFLLWVQMSLHLKAIYYRLWSITCNYRYGFPFSSQFFIIMLFLEGFHSRGVSYKCFYFTLLNWIHLSFLFPLDQGWPDYLLLISFTNNQSYVVFPFCLSGVIGIRY